MTEPTPAAEGGDVQCELREIQFECLSVDQEIRARALEAASRLAGRWNPVTTGPALDFAKEFEAYIRDGITPLPEWERELLDKQCAEADDAGGVTDE